MRASLGAMATLARWLGPWTDAARAPAAIEREERRLGDHGVKVYTYRGHGRPRGVYVIAPGLHFLGPDDARMDRLCRVFARAGLTVVVPFLRDHLDLLIAARAVDDLAVAYEHAETIARARRLPAPCLFSISFGSAPAIALAADARYRERIGGLVLFGGFADIRATVRFVLSGHVDASTDNGHSPPASIAAPYDPLNTPAVFLNLVPQLALADATRLRGAWHQMVRRTWHVAEMKRPGARDTVAAALAATLPSTQRELFLMGCGLVPGGVELFERCFVGGAFGFAAGAAELGRVAAPVAIVHGAGDDVIPCAEAYKLRAALPPGRGRHFYITGLYGHGGVEGRGAGAGRFAELRTLVGLLRALVAAPTGRLA